jgi:hypothetical protein
MQMKRKVIATAIIASGVFMASAAYAAHEDCSWQGTETLGEYLAERLWGEFAGYCIGEPYGRG